MHILVIEDDASLRTLYREFLEPDGHSLELTSDGWEGFKAGGAGGFDLIIADLNMPHWNGATAIESLSVLHPDVPVIIVTGFPESEIAYNAKQVPQVQHLLTKPLDFIKLLSLIDTFRQ